MKKIGVLFGVENTFPGALVERINAMGVAGVVAEPAELGGVVMGEPSGYAVLVDRISHDLPFYRSYLKHAVLHGAEVINNPFWWSADDKFFNYALAETLGVAVPKTVLLPHKNYPPQINTQSLRNLQFPLDWERIFGYVGFPAFLKPHDGGGWRDVYHVHTEQEFFRAYDLTRDLCMTLQAAVDFQEYFRCYVVGQREVRIMRYDPRRPHDQRYIQEPQDTNRELLERVERDALTLCRALGYDLNTVEFAVQDGIPYAIDFMNPAPDADFFSVGQENFHWIVDAVARLAVEKAQKGPALRGELRCMSLLNGQEAGAVKAPEQGAASARAKDGAGEAKAGTADVMETAGAVAKGDQAGGAAKQTKPAGASRPAGSAVGKAATPVKTAAGKAAGGAGKVVPGIAAAGAGRSTAKGKAGVSASPKSPASKASSGTKKS